jgi:predicted Zn-dependent protease with MMP-like domain
LIAFVRQLPDFEAEIGHAAHKRDRKADRTGPRRTNVIRNLIGRPDRHGIRPDYADPVATESSRPGGPSRRGPGGRRRDRRGRGLRGELAPAGIPLARTRSEEFDDLILDAVEDLERSWAAELADVEFAVEDVPSVAANSAIAAELDPEVIDDHGVPLGRLVRGATTGARPVHPLIVIYRRPLESRAADREDRADLVFSVVAELVAEALGKDVDEIDPR